MQRKHSSSWKQDERATAELFNTALDSERLYNHKITRIPLSGSNNRRTDGSDHRGDLSLPDCFDFLVECKRRASFSFMRLFESAQADAKKHGLNPKHTILVSKELRQRGFAATIDMGFLLEILSIRQVQELLKRPENKIKVENLPEIQENKRLLKLMKSSPPNTKESFKYASRAPLKPKKSKRVFDAAEEVFKDSPLREMDN